MTYLEKLKDPRWQKKRLEVLERDKWTCQRCKSKGKTLHVHHNTYIDGIYNPWDYNLTLLLTLCEDCHKYEEDNKELAIDKLLTSIRCWLLTDNIILLRENVLEKVRRRK